MVRMLSAPALLSALFFAFATNALVGCETIEGAGEDMQSGGEAVEDAADDSEE